MPRNSPLPYGPLALLASQLVTGMLALDATPPPYVNALEGAAIEVARLSDIGREALLVGNGDLHALFWERDGTLCLRVSKNDIWDARIDTSNDPALLKVDIPGQKWSGGGGNIPSWQKPYPTPRCAALVRIGANGQAPWRCIRAEGVSNTWEQADARTGMMAIAGKRGASAGYEITLPAASGAVNRVQFTIRGTPNAKYYMTLYSAAGVKESGWLASPTSEEAVTFEASAIQRLLLYIWTTDGARAENRIRDIVLTSEKGAWPLQPGMRPGGLRGARLDLRRAVATAGEVSVRALSDRNVFLVETDQALSLEEIAAKELPAAELGETDGCPWLLMRMPGDADYRGMEYALAVANKGRRKAVAVVTSFDTKEPVREAALRLARRTLEEAPATVIGRHEAAWERYWSASGVSLADADFERWWYRMVYYLGSATAHQATPIGLYVGMATDYPSWHGDYHHNYNAWQPYWTPLNINHPERVEPWINYMHAMLPRLRWLAKTIYDCEGACVGISSFAFEPDPASCTSKNRRQVWMVPWGCTLGMMGMSVQNLWYSHLYRPDKKLLEQKIYPVLREAALFYCSFLEKCPRDPNGVPTFGPSYSPEHGAFGVANVPFDIAYARLTLNAAISATEELGCDRACAARLRQALRLLPPYPTAPDASGQPVVVDWRGCAFRQVGEHNITVPAVPVFPADQVTWFSPEAEKELFRNTMRQTRHRGLNATIMLSVAKARLSMPEALEEARNYYKPLEQPNGFFVVPACGYYLVESVGLAAMISEFLLQSAGGTLRVFPCWPKEKDARFTRLRAQGGFLVTAEQRAGKITQVEITATADGTLRLVNPWTQRIMERKMLADQRWLLTE